MDIFSPIHLLIILVLVVLLFGTSKLTKIGPDLGKAVRGFKQALHDGDDDASAKAKQGATPDKLQADPPAAAEHQAQHDSTEAK